MFRSGVERVTSRVGEKSSHSIIRMICSTFADCDGLSPIKRRSRFEVLICSKFQQHLHCFEDLVRTRTRLPSTETKSRYSKITV